MVYAWSMRTEHGASEWVSEWVSPPWVGSTQWLFGVRNLFPPPCPPRTYPPCWLDRPPTYLRAHTHSLLPPPTHLPARLKCTFVEVAHAHTCMPVWTTLCMRALWMYVYLCVFMCISVCACVLYMLFRVCVCVACILTCKCVCVCVWMCHYDTLVLVTCMHVINSMINLM